MGYADYTDRIVPVYGQAPPVPEQPLYPDTLGVGGWAGLCPSVAPKGARVSCSRDAGHTGLHEAGISGGIAARWDDDRTTDDHPPAPRRRTWKDRLRALLAHRKDRS